MLDVTLSSSSSNSSLSSFNDLKKSASDDEKKSAGHDSVCHQPNKKTKSIPRSSMKKFVHAAKNATRPSPVNVNFGGDKHMEAMKTAKMDYFNSKLKLEDDKLNIDKERLQLETKGIGANNISLIVKANSDVSDYILAAMRRRREYKKEYPDADNVELDQIAPFMEFPKLN